MNLHTMDKIVSNIITLLGIKEKEKVLLVYDSTTSFFVIPLSEKISKTNDCEIHDIDSFNRPLDYVPKELDEAAKRCDVCFYAIEKVSNTSVNELSFRKKFNALARDYDIRMGNLLSPNEVFLKSAFCMDILELKEITEKLCEYMKTVQSVRITSPAGTDIILDFDDKYNWIASTGFAKRGINHNLMPCEVNTYPANVNGKVVVDGTYGYLNSLDEYKDYSATLKLLKENPMVWNIENGSITSVSCNDLDLQSIAEKMILGDIENSERIGELGIGTNLGIKELIGILMHDEKSPTVHIAHGHGYPHKTNAPYECKIHYDGVMREATIINNDTGEIIMEKGKIKIID